MIDWQLVWTMVRLYASSLAFLILGIIAQKIIFLESHTRQQFKSILKLILSMLILLLCIHIPMLSIKSGQEYMSVILLIAMALTMIVTPLVYCSYIGRKRHKWLAFLEFIPIVGFIDGIWGLIDGIKILIPSESLQNIYDVAIPAILLAAIAISLWKKPRFVRTLIRDIKSRSLSGGEEVVVWIVGIWLFVYDTIIEDSIAGHLTDLIAAYTNILNFVAAFIIVAYVYNSNYKDYYYKKNLHLQRSLISTVAELIENRDENTGGHVLRTSRYVEIIARKLQKQAKYKGILTNKYINDMVIAAPLHDVGKIHIPDAILNKPGKLDAEEYATMKTHSAAGGNIISRIESTTGEMEYLKIAKEMAEYHHERIDGKGYPHGLAGEEIPLSARILAVADVFDAVSSKRCYKEAFPLDQSFAIIKEEAGTHFDMDVAQAFLESRPEVEAYINRCRRQQES